jgi:hypothetical protein
MAGGAAGGHYTDFDDAAPRNKLLEFRYKCAKTRNPCCCAILLDTKASAAPPPPRPVCDASDSKEVQLQPEARPH